MIFKISQLKQAHKIKWRNFLYLILKNIMQRPKDQYSSKLSLRQQLSQVLRKQDDLWLQSNQQSLKKSIEEIQQAKIIIKKIISTEKSKKVASIFKEKYEQIQIRFQEKVQYIQNMNSQTQYRRIKQIGQLSRHFTIEYPTPSINIMNNFQTPTELREFYRDFIRGSDFSQNYFKLFQKNVLIVSPPGTNLFQVVKSMAGQSNYVLFIISCADIAIEFQQSQRIIKNLFNKAAHFQKSMIIFNQIEYICGFDQQHDADQLHKKMRRKRCILLLNLIEQYCYQNPLNQVFSCTNRPWELNQLIRRKLYKFLSINLPNFRERIQLLKRQLQSYPNSLEPLDYQQIGTLTLHFSHEEIKNLISVAAQKSLKYTQRNDPMKQFQLYREKSKITRQVINQALKIVKPTLDLQDRNRY